MRNTDGLRKDIRLIYLSEKSLRRLHSVSFLIFCFGFIVFLLLFFWSCSCCCVIVPGTLAFHLLDVEFAIILVFFCLSSVSQSVTTESVSSLWDKESGRILSVLMKLGREDDLM